MGRWPRASKQTVEECLAIDMPWLARHKYLNGLRAGVVEWKNRLGEVTSSIGLIVSTGGASGNYVRLQYSLTGAFTREETTIDYSIRLDTTPCNFGGARYWFICPLSTNGRHCGRRVAKLYLPSGGRYFGCRHCHSLTYRSCREHDKRVDALRRLPPDVLMSLLNSDNSGQMLLAAKAALKGF